MASNIDKIGHHLAKSLFIDIDYRKDATKKSHVSVPGVDDYLETEPTAADYFREFAPNGKAVKSYFRDLFPFLNWITKYNLQWLSGDLVAGLTVGAVVVPQGMAYALLAKLPPEYGLYTSFVGYLLYWIFATSKDVTIGTIAVMSTLVGEVNIKVREQHPDIPPEEIARTLSFVAGGIILLMGLARIGWILEWIPTTSIAAFMTGAATTVGVGQISTLLGIPNVSNSGPAYMVFINTMKALPNARIDATLGVSALFLLYSIRFGFQFLQRRFPQKKKFFFFLSTLRIAFVLLLHIFISWLVNRNVVDLKDAHFRVLGKIPRGFRHIGAPQVQMRTIKAFASDLPATVIVLLIEHIAISKSFARINNYTINPSQELVAVGFTNIFGPFFGGYPATGSCSRTAINSNAGVRTPLAGIFTAFVVLLALYVLTGVFCFIPMATLAAVIIHAVGDLITSPSVVYQFWTVSPLEVPIFFLGVFMTFFNNIEKGIYATIAASGLVLLFRLSRAKGRFVGRTTIRSLASDSFPKPANHNDKSDQTTTFSPLRNVFLPLDRKDDSNPDVRVEQPHPGVFIYRFSEGFIYPNSQHYMEHFLEHIFKATRRTTIDSYTKPGDRPWNNPGPRRGKTEESRAHLPILRAVILDFSTVNDVDVSAVQNLVDARKQLDRHAAPATVGWHFANVNSRWTRRALASAGFGYPKISSPELDWKSVISVANLDDSVSTAGSHMEPRNDLEHQSDEIGSGPPPPAPSCDEKRGYIPPSGRTVPLYGLNRPFFHVDVLAAVEAALAVVQQQEAQVLD